MKAKEYADKFIRTKFNNEDEYKKELLAATTRMLKEIKVLTSVRDNNPIKIIDAQIHKYNQFAKLINAKNPVIRKHIPYDGLLNLMETEMPKLYAAYMEIKHGRAIPHVLKTETKKPTLWKRIKRIFQKQK